MNPKGDRAALAERCRGLDGRGYPAYRGLEGVWTLGDGLTLFVDRVARDPFAPPSPMRLRLAGSAARIPAGLVADRTRRIALGDCLARRFAKAVGRTEDRGAGSGHSGEIRVDAGGAEVLERSAIRFGPEADGSAVAFVEARFEVGLPAAGRRILGRGAAALLTETLPQVAAEGLALPDPPPAEVEGFVRVVEEQESLRAALGERGLVAFVADGAILPRLHGASSRPLGADRAVPFASPESLRVALPLRPGGDDAETVSGMGIPEGVTLIVGGGYHGKSTLLQALAAAVFPHVPGDGRERCATRADAVTVRAEEGRAVHAVDVSPFLRDLPGGRTTDAFSTEDASGSTSQAASIVEALESGSRLLLLDEDTSATNLLIRDARMQALVAGRAEPIVPLLDRVRELYERHRVSTILVMGGCGDYFDAADTVIRMDSYRAGDATAEARRVAAALPTRRAPETEAAGFFRRVRTPKAKTFDASGKRGWPRIRATARNVLLYGEREVDLAALTHLFDHSQTRAAGYAASLLADRFAGRPLGEALDGLEDLLDREGLDLLTPEGRAGKPSGRLARARRHEIAGLMNRLRGGRFDSAPADAASPPAPAGEDPAG